MILLDLSTGAQNEPEIADATGLPVLLKPSTLLQILGPDSLPLKPLVIDPEGISTQTSEADLIARTQLVGLYEGQIRARIEQAWLRPRSPLTQEQFDCRVKIAQDTHGNILQVTLQKCQGPQAWQDSMVRAVMSASPLPAPPNPAVFVDAIQMSFHSGAYVEGCDEPVKLRDV